MRLAASQVPASSYPFKTELAVRLADLDFARHVNNAVIAAFHEETRVRFHLRHFGVDTVFDRKPGGGVIAHVSIDYLRETVHGLPVIGCIGVARLGRTSYTLVQGLFQADLCTSEATCVIANREGGRAEALGNDMRALLTRLMMPAA